MRIKYVFCINPGRAGSNYLTALLKHSMNAVSEHEAMPIMNGRPMWAFNQGDERPLRALMPRKLAQIQQARGRKRHIYCETNHQFINGFGYLLPEFLAQEEIGVVVLRRDVTAAAYSRLRIHDVPGRTTWTRDWLLDPAGTRHQTSVAAAASPYTLCEWHVREVYARAEAYRAQFPHITYFDVDLDRLNDRETVLRLFETFGIRPKPSLFAAIGQRVNERNEWPKISVAALEQVAVYPSIDALAPADKANMINAIVAWLLEHRAAELAAWTPNWAYMGSCIDQVTQVFAEAERELERVFQIGLFYSEAEFQIMMKVVGQIRPHDAMLALVPENTDYAFEPFVLDLNQEIDGEVYRRIGISFLTLLLDRARMRIGKKIASRDTINRVPTG